MASSWISTHPVPVYEPLRRSKRAQVLVEAEGTMTDLCVLCNFIVFPLVWAYSGAFTDMCDGHTAVAEMVGGGIIHETD